eukprot:CAMPEP_0172884116 /NCGR_PEP_ID=MMETSP1075-20121228/124354_1 /TAXON_ID=2916 /ORGANISM="Ceratium fusus, Strain PA161109" /LENGTH=92 /DNA_ID=CAMNT_0013737157 /DNA_START=863 /DNA_END=1138 /DNA_ORIENTATION=+
MAYLRMRWRSDILLACLLHQGAGRRGTATEWHRTAPRLPTDCTLWCPMLPLGAKEALGSIVAMAIVAAGTNGSPTGEKRVAFTHGPRALGRP